MVQNLNSQKYKIKQNRKEKLKNKQKIFYIPNTKKDQPGTEIGIFACKASGVTQKDPETLSEM